MVYIRYKDHILFRNITKPIKDATERETVGWLTGENNEIICIQNDRTVKSLFQITGTASGLVILKNCILEIRALPLQESLKGSLNCLKDEASSVEYALQKAKRKTQPK